MEGGGGSSRASRAHNLLKTQWCKPEGNLSGLTAYVIEKSLATADVLRQMCTDEELLRFVETELMLF